MKSIANQYKDLKEGRISQTNFMRNLRMSMPQYITNTTSFNDAVRILKNKAILNEYQDYPGREDQSSIDNTNMFNDAVQNSISRLNAGEYPGIEEFVNNMDIDVYDDVIVMANDPDDAVAEFIRMFEDTEFDNMIKRSEDELGPDKYKFNDDENTLSESEFTYRNINGICYKIDDEGNKTKVDSRYCRNLNEGKKKKEPKQALHPNQIHPSELRMGIRVEMEHTGDPKKAEKIALDHLAENPYYYTALKLSGIESPSAPKAKAPVAAKKAKKKDATEMVDTANQMQKVKLIKESLEKLIREEVARVKKKLNEERDISSKSIKDMRNWLKDISWADMEPEEIDDISDNEIIVAVRNNYEGGLKAFLKDNKSKK